MTPVRNNDPPGVGVEARVEGLASPANKMSQPPSVRPKIIMEARHALRIVVNRGNGVNSTQKDSARERDASEWEAR